MPSAPIPPAPSSPQADIPDESFVLALPDDPASSNDWYLWAGVLALLVLVVFFPAVTGKYIWDDDHHPGVIPYYSTLDGLAKIWTPQAATPQYYPLTFTTYWIEYHLWQDHTLGYHLDNMVLHAASAILLWRLLRRLKFNGAWLAAAIWAIHPLQTESVAWISERKNVLSGLLFFSSIWFYLEFDGWAEDGSTLVLGNKRLAYWLSWFLFVLALLAKTVACAMPAAILILAWWRGRKVLDRKVWVPLLPFIAAGLLLAAVTVFLETAAGGNVQARGPDWDLSPVERLLIAGRGVWFYVCKLLWPSNLTFSYPRIVPSPDLMTAGQYTLQWVYVAAAVAVVAILWLGRGKFGRGPLAAVLYYLVAIFPALGFINIFPMRYSFVADHFQYLAGLGLILLAVGILDRVMRLLRIPISAATAVAAAMLAAIFYPAWVQAHIYESPQTLWEDTLAKNPNSWMACDNLGVELINLGELKQRDAASERAQDQTDDATADEQEAQDDFTQAEQLFFRALQLRPQNYATHNALGLLYRQLGRWADAEAQLKTAVDMDQRDDPPHQLIAPYLAYVQVLQHNHPQMDVRPWLDMAMAVADQPHSRLRDAAVAHLAYGDYWCGQAGKAAKAAQADDEAADLTKAITELNLGLKTLPDDIAGLFNLAQAYQRMGLIDQDKADRERAAGNLQQAADDEFRSHQIDNKLALNSYMGVLDRVPYHRYAGALEGIGELYFRDTIERDNQTDAVTDLLTAMKFFTDALATDPNVPEARRYIGIIEKDLMEQGHEAMAHEAAWAALRQKAQSLAAGQVSKAAVTDTMQTVHDVVWILPKAHPMEFVLQNFRGALEFYLAGQAANGDDVRAAASALLKAWKDRDPAMDSINDAMNAALCFQGAVTADAHSAEAWESLRAQTNVLADAAAKTPDAPGLKEALRVAQFVLDQHRAATQPTTSPTAMPTFGPALQ